jgi:hypothetical protein
MASTLTIKSTIKKAKKGMEVNGINIAVSNLPFNRTGDYPPLDFKPTLIALNLPGFPIWMYLKLLQARVVFYLGTS